MNTEIQKDRGRVNEGEPCVDSEAMPLLDHHAYLACKSRTRLPLGLRALSRLLFVLSLKSLLQNRMLLRT